MSTRSQVVIKDSNSEQWFYRHSDGYPSGNMPQLHRFMRWRTEGRIRSNVEQASGWLVLIGADEYGYDYNIDTGIEKRRENLFEPNGSDQIGGWKCGAYEICTCGKEHGDIEWLYTIDLEANNITVRDIRSGIERRFSYDELNEYCSDWQRFEGLF